MTDEVGPDGPCGANDIGGTAWEDSFANSASVELSLDARMGRYPRSVFVWPPKRSSAICAGAWSMSYIRYREWQRQQIHQRHAQKRGAKIKGRKIVESPEKGRHSQRTTYLPAATAAKTSCYTTDRSAKSSSRDSIVHMTWQSGGTDEGPKHPQEKGMLEEFERTYMGHFTREIDVRIHAIQYRTTGPRTDRNRSNLAWHHRSSDVD